MALADKMAEWVKGNPVVAIGLVGGVAVAVLVVSAKKGSKGSSSSGSGSGTPLQFIYQVGQSSAPPNSNGGYTYQGITGQGNQHPGPQGGPPGGHGGPTPNPYPQPDPGPIPPSPGPMPWYLPPPSHHPGPQHGGNPIPTFSSIAEEINSWSVRS